MDNNKVVIEGPQVKLKAYCEGCEHLLKIDNVRACKKLDVKLFKEGDAGKTLCSYKCPFLNENVKSFCNREIEKLSWKPMGVIWDVFGYDRVSLTWSELLTACKKIRNDYSDVQYSKALAEMIENEFVLKNEERYELTEWYRMT